MNQLMSQIGCGIHWAMNADMQMRVVTSRDRETTTSESNLLL